MQKLALTLAAGLIISVLWTPKASAQIEEIGLTIRPAILEITGQPGTTSTVQITVQNDSTDAIGVSIDSRSLLPNDPEIDQNKRFLYDASSWIVPVQKDLLLVPNQQAVTDIQVIIPENAAPGGHYALITYTPVQSAELREDTNTVRTQPEVTSLALITVPGDIVEKAYAEIDSGSGVKLNAQISTTAKFFNEGNVHILPSISATVFRADGTPVESIPVPPELSLPNTIKNIDTAWFPQGEYGRFYIQYDFTYGTPSQTITARTNTFLVIPAPLTLLFMAAIGIVGVVLLRVLWKVVHRRISRKRVYRQTSRRKKSKSNTKSVDLEPSLMDRIIKDSSLDDRPKRRKISPSKPQTKPPQKPPQKKKPKKIKVH